MPDSPSSSEPLDPTLFAEGPARDERFVVKDRWVECENYPGDHPLHQVEFTHRQMNEEVNGLECSAGGLTDFPDADWELRMWLARQCADEARHARMFPRLLESRGGRVGQFPVLNFQYRIITKADTGGMELRFGDADLMIQLLEMTAHLQGFGDLLAEGMDRLAKRWKVTDQPCHLAVKGQELPMHDPRVKVGVGMGYAIGR